MIRFIFRGFSKVLLYVVNTAKKLLTMLTLFSVLFCLVLFFHYFFAGELLYALISLVGMLSFLYVNLKC